MQSPHLCAVGLVDEGAEPLAVAAAEPMSRQGAAHKSSDHPEWFPHLRRPLWTASTSLRPAVWDSLLEQPPRPVSRGIPVAHLRLGRYADRTSKHHLRCIAHLGGGG